MNNQESRVGRVVRQERGIWTVEMNSSTWQVEHIRGEMRPVAGDFVELREGLEAIERVLPRRSVVVRRAAGTRTEPQVLAANADVALVVMGLDGDYNPRRLERYLAMAAGGGVRAAVLLNKSDLVCEPEVRAAEVRRLGTGAPVVVLSAIRDDAGLLLGGLVKRGETAVLLGSSGAGKSTLVNRLLGHEAQTTGPVRARDERGRHTTTSRRLIAMPGGWSLIDLPGLREVGLMPGMADLEGAFVSILGMAERCRFRDCTHTVEPGCAVREAAEPGQMESLRKLRDETRFSDKQEAKRRQRAIRAFQRTERFNRW
ncbi:MAG TPA: ribosome small subunit-dependent GTPase A [Bryobacteraceae bacterium]|nr:ribosome small subunit-dependent GTPase A [Bryobacterales bacterium]HRJ17952.1 ribosome small subunit-dependent GTPase A [Bryobacteraceae bacterium]